MNNSNSNERIFNDNNELSPTYQQQLNNNGRVIEIPVFHYPSQAADTQTIDSNLNSPPKSNFTQPLPQQQYAPLPQGSLFHQRPLFHNTGVFDEFDSPFDILENRQRQRFFQDPSLFPAQPDDFFSLPSFHQQDFFDRSKSPLNRFGINRSFSPNRVGSPIGSPKLSNFKQHQQPQQSQQQPQQPQPQQQQQQQRQAETPIKISVSYSNQDQNSDNINSYSPNAASFSRYPPVINIAGTEETLNKRTPSRNQSPGPQIKQPNTQSSYSSLPPSISQTRNHNTPSSPAPVPPPVAPSIPQTRNHNTPSSPAPVPPPVTPSISQTRNHNTPSSPASTPVAPSIPTPVIITPPEPSTPPSSIDQQKQSVKIQTERSQSPKLNQEEPKISMGSSQQKPIDTNKSPNKPTNDQSDFVRLATEAANMRNTSRSTTPVRTGPKTSQEKIDEITLKLDDLFKKVDNYNGTTKDKQFLILEEYLTRCLLDLDEIDRNDDRINQLRKALIVNTQKIIEKLEAKLQPRNNKNEIIETSMPDATQNNIKTDNEDTNRQPQETTKTE